MSNPTGKGGFGERPAAINKKGRPKTFDAWRKLAQELVGEPATDKTGLILIKIPLIKGGVPVVDKQGNPVMVDHYATNAEMIARSWLKDAKRQVDLIEAAFGKVPQPVDLTSGGKTIPVTMIEIVKEIVKSKDE